MDSVVEWRCRWVPSWLVYKWVGFMSDMRMSCRCVSLEILMTPQRFKYTCQPSESVEGSQKPGGEREERGD
jgi:hypothetical protein